MRERETLAGQAGFPVPTGPHAVGRVNFDLVDRDREDPYARRGKTPRGLAVSWNSSRGVGSAPVWSSGTDVRATEFVEKQRSHPGVLFVVRSEHVVGREVGYRSGRRSGRHVLLSARSGYAPQVVR
jgi:hypothetical protein